MALWFAYLIGYWGLHFFWVGFVFLAVWKIEVKRNQRVFLRKFKEYVVEKELKDTEVKLIEMLRQVFDNFVDAYRTF